jgi:uncharacterized membrane protein YbjE (DUF340 family)
MQSVTILLIILLPLVVGFLIRLPKEALVWLNRGLGYLIYVLLFLIGLSLSRVPNLSAQINIISVNVMVLFACIMGANLLILIWLDRRYPWHLSQHQHNKIQNTFSFGGSFKQIACLVMGLICGIYSEICTWFDPESAIKYALIVLIFLVGVQLRSSGISLRQVLLNRRGVIIALIFMFSCIIGGIIFAMIMPGMTLSKGLALSSGYGWYSLSSIILSQVYGPVWGSVAMLNDLAREIFALFFIPVIMRRFPCTAIASGGATSLDFTLPVIQSSGGITAVPVAISFGFIVNLVSPILLVFFSSVSF